DDVIQGEVCERAVTLGLATIMTAREVIVLVSGEAKRAPLARMLDGPVTPEAGLGAPYAPALSRHHRPRRAAIIRRGVTSSVGRSRVIHRHPPISTGCRRSAGPRKRDERPTLGINPVDNGGWCG